MFFISSFQAIPSESPTVDLASPIFIPSTSHQNGKDSQSDKWLQNKAILVWGTTLILYNLSLTWLEHLAIKKLKLGAAFLSLSVFNQSHCLSKRLTYCIWKTTTFAPYLLREIGNKFYFPVPRTCDRGLSANSPWQLSQSNSRIHIDHVNVY